MNPLSYITWIFSSAPTTPPPADQNTTNSGSEIGVIDEDSSSNGGISSSSTNSTPNHTPQASPELQSRTHTFTPPAPKRNNTRKPLVGEEVQIESTAVTNELLNYPLKDSFLELRNLFLVRYWHVPSTGGKFLIDRRFVNDILLPEIRGYFNAKQNLDSASAKACAGFEGQGDWYEKLKEVQGELEKSGKGLTNDLLQMPTSAIDGKQLAGLISFLKRVELVAPQEQEQKAGWYEVISENVQWGWNGISTPIVALGKSLKIINAESSSENKIQESDWEQITYWMYRMIDIATNKNSTEEEKLKIALSYLNAGRRIGLLKEVGRKIVINPEVLNGWIQAQHRSHEKKLGIVSGSAKLEIASEWESICLEAANLSQALLNHRYQNTPKALDFDIEHDAMHAEKLASCVTQEKFSYLQALYYTEDQSLIKAHGKPSHTKAEVEALFSRFFGLTLELSKKIQEKKLSRAESTSLIKAVDEFQKAIENTPYFTLHWEAKKQLDYFCKTLKALAQPSNNNLGTEPTSDEKDRTRNFLRAYEAFMAAHFSLTRGYKHEGGLKHDYGKWCSLWAQNISKNSKADVALNAFASWNESEEMQSSWPSKLYQKIYAVTTIAEYTEDVQLYRKVKIYAILQILDFIFSTELCRVKEGINKGEYSSYYQELIVNWDPDKETVFYDDLFTILADNYQFNIFYIGLARFICALLDPVLDQAIRKAVDNANTKVSELASNFPNEKMLKATMASQRNGIIMTICEVFNNILIADGEVHGEIATQTPVERTGNPLKQVQDRLKLAKFHKQKTQEQIYYDADRKLVDLLSISPEWVEDTKAYFDEKIEDTNAKALKIFYTVVKYIAIIALYLPEKITGYILREVLFHFYHNSAVSTQGLVNLFQTGFSSGDSSNSIINSMFYNLLEQMDQSLISEKKKVDQMIRSNGQSALYSKTELTSSGNNLVGPDIDHCKNAIDRLLLVLGRYHEFFNQPNKDKAKDRKEAAMEEQVKSIAMGLGEQLIKSLDSVMTSDFIKERYVELQSQLNASLDGKGSSSSGGRSSNVVTTRDVMEKINIVTDRAIDHAVQSQVIVSDDINLAHIRSYEIAFQKIYQETLANAITRFNEEGKKHANYMSNHAGKEGADCLENMAARLKLFTDLDEAVAKFRKETKALIDNAKMTKIDGVNEKGEYKLETQLEAMQNKIEEELISQISSVIDSGLKFQDDYKDLQTQLHTYQAIEKAKMEDLISGKILRKSMLSPMRRKLYFARLTSALIAQNFPNTKAHPATATSFWGLYLSLQRLGIFPLDLEFGKLDENGSPIKPDLLKDFPWSKFGLSRISTEEREDLEGMLLEIAEGLYGAMDEVHDTMSEPSWWNSMMGGRKVFSDSSAKIFIDTIKEQIDALKDHAQTCQNDFKVANMKTIEERSNALRKVEDQFKENSSTSLVSLMRSAQHEVDQFKIQRTKHWTKKATAYAVKALTSTETTQIAAETAFSEIYKTFTKEDYQDAMKGKMETFGKFLSDPNSLLEHLVQGAVLDHI